MRIALYFVVGAAVAGIIYSLGPDIRRYLKIKCM